MKYKSKNFFNSHLIETKMSYTRHMFRALLFFIKSFIASFAFLNFMHIYFPPSLGLNFFKAFFVFLRSFTHKLIQKLDTF